MSYRPEIDGMRFIAITLVLFFHLGFSDWAGGFTGVDIFFVLSGYLICGQIYVALLEQKFSVVDFFARRVRRLSTAAFACFFVTGGLAFFIFNPFEMDGVVQNLLGSITFTNNILLMSEAGYFEPSAASNPFLHTWSLSIEEQFYIFLPLAILCLRFRAGAFVALLCTAFAVSLALTLLSGSAIYSQDARYFSSVLRVWQLALGGLSYIVLYQMAGGVRFFGLPLVGLAMMIAPTFVMQETALHPGPWALVATFGTVIVLFSASPAHSRCGWVLSSRPLRYLGRISYGTYLWHWPIIVFYEYVGGDFSDKTRLLTIVLSFGMGALSHHLIEEPVRKISVTSQRSVLFGMFAVQTLVLAGLVGALWLRGKNVDADEFASFVKVQEYGKIPNEKWEQCWYSGPETEACRFGNTQSDQRPILLWGDSMANSAMPVFETLAEQRQTSGVIYATPSCPPLYGVMRDVDNASFCFDMNETVLERLKTAPPTDVYLFARWPHYVEGVHKNMWGDFDKVDFVDRDANVVSGNRVSVFTKALGDLLTRVGPRHHVVLIGSPPEFPYSVPNEMIKRIRFQRPVEHLARYRFDGRAKRTNEILADVSQVADITFVDLTDVFCDPAVCHISQDGVPLFSDHVHLSAKGNALLLTELGGH